MKTLKYLLSVIVLITTTVSCVEEDFGNADFINTAVAPTNVTAAFNITQDNTGLVTITPNAQGAISYTVNLGDTSEVISLNQGESTEHTYAEGSYNVVVTAKGITGLTTKTTVPLVVSFKAPSNLEVAVTNDQAVSKKVSVTVTADDATVYEVDFGDGSDVQTVNIGETISYTYAEAGTYTITVTAKGAAKETTSTTKEVEATILQQPTVSAPTPSKAQTDVISIFSNKYTDLENVDYNPNWGQTGTYTAFDLDGDNMLQYTNMTYQGIDFSQTIDVSGMDYLHLDVWTADAESLNTFLISTASGEKSVVSTLTVDGWTSIDIPLSDFTDQGLSIDDIFQFKFEGIPSGEASFFIDNLYFWKESSTSTFDDGLLTNGDFESGSNPWIVGVADDSPVTVVTEGGNTYYSVNVATAGNAWDVNMSQKVAITEGQTYTLSFDAWSDTNRSIIAGIGLSADPWTNVTETVNITTSKTTYTLTLVATGFGATDARVIFDLGADAGIVNIDNVSLVLGSGGTTPASPIEGTWKIASEAGALAVGDSGMGSNNWWTIDATGVTQRSCFFDDTYVFNADGTFQNVMDGSTWVEAWQGVASDGCETPAAPHNGSATATYTYDASAATVTLNGTGAFIGLSKAYNGGELASPSDAPESITYDVEIVDASTINVGISIGAGYWTFKLVKQ